MFISKLFYNTPFKRLELKRYSIIILSTVLYGKIIGGVVNVYCNIFQFGEFKALSLKCQNDKVVLRGTCSMHPTVLIRPP